MSSVRKLAAALAVAAPTVFALGLTAPAAHADHLEDVRTCVTYDFTGRQACVGHDGVELD